MTATPTHLTQDPELLVRLIISRTSHIVTKRRQAARILLDLPRKRGQDARALTAAQLEQTVEHWQVLLPAGAAERGAVGRLLAARYGIDPATAPQAAQLLQIAHQRESAAERAAAPPAQAAAPEEALVSSVAELLEWRFYRRGATLYAQGDAADTLFVIVDGLVRVVHTAADGARLTVSELAGGRLLGERSLVLGEQRSSTAYAVQDSDVCVMPLGAVEQLLRQDPQVVVKLLAEMAQRMQIGRPAAVPTRNGRVLAVVPAAGEIQEFAHRLTRQLEAHGATLFVGPAEAEKFLAEYGPLPLEEVVDAYGFVDWMQQQAAHYATVVYLADSAYPNWTRRIVEQADRILLVGRAGDSPVLSPAEMLIKKLDHPELLPPQELVMLHEREQDNPGDTGRWLEKRNIIRHHHVALDSGRGIDRVSRFVRGRAVGLVFGGGGMRSAACAGVARALAELGIEADVVGGTSAGSIAAALYAMGYDVQTMTDITVNQLMKKKIWVQPTLPLVSVLSAQRLIQAYRQVYGDVAMEDLWITPFTISGNLTRAEMVVHRRGPLHHAVRASTAIAGVMPPALNTEGDLLIDGGIFNNTPADVARTMVDTGPVIAVDLGFTKRQDHPYAYGDSLSGWQVLRRRLNPFAAKIATPSIVSIMMRANALGSINATQQQVSHADLVLRPPVGDYGLFDFDDYGEIADAGYRYALQPIREWLASGGMEGG